MPVKLWPFNAARKAAGTETRPLRSILLKYVDENNATARSPSTPATSDSVPGNRAHAALRASPCIGTNWANMGKHVLSNLYLVKTDEKSGLSLKSGDKFMESRVIVEIKLSSSFVLSHARLYT